MATNRQHIQHYIRDFDFKRLFVDELGWDNLHEQALTVSFENQTFLLHPLVEKRGFKVYRVLKKALSKPFGSTGSTSLGNHLPSSPEVRNSFRNGCETKVW